MGEPSRLIPSEWEDAENSVWLDPQRRRNKYDEVDASFLENLKITFQGGKGNKLVPVFIPPDCTEGLRKLANNELRKSLCIYDCNKYFFPCFYDSIYHIYRCDVSTKSAPMLALKNRTFDVNKVASQSVNDLCGYGCA